MSSSSPSSDSATHDPLFSEIARVCEAATKGDLEPRVVGESDNEDLTAVAHAINHLLDGADVYVRESTASLRAASDGRYYRRVLVRGMHGSFRAGAELLNCALVDMADQKARLVQLEENRVAMIRELERTLVESADRISSAIRQISDITKNTHVLALNAKIEAARAGEAGRGFSIVAHEVETTSNKVSQVMAEIHRVFAAFKVETHAALDQMAQAKAA